jgi:hypothetical protein
MNGEIIANGAPYYLITDRSNCSLDCFWVVILDNNMAVFQDEPRSDIRPCNPWLRLKKFCEDTGAKILGMAFIGNNDPNKQLNLKNNAEGYFYAKRIRALFNAGVWNFQDVSEGVGYLENDTLIIYWYINNVQVEIEYRNILDYHPQMEDSSLIRV